MRQFDALPTGDAGAEQVAGQAMSVHLDDCFAISPRTAEVRSRVAAGFDGLPLAGNYFGLSRSAALRGESFLSRSGCPTSRFELLRQTGCCPSGRADTLSASQPFSASRFSPCDLPNQSAQSRWSRSSSPVLGCTNTSSAPWFSVSQPTT